MWKPVQGVSYSWGTPPSLDQQSPLFLLAYSNAMRSARWSILENAGEKDQKFSHHLDNTTVHNLCILPDLPVHIYFCRYLFSVLEKQDHITCFPCFFFLVF